MISMAMPTSSLRHNPSRSLWLRKGKSVLIRVFRA